MRTAVIGASNSLVSGGVVQGLIDGGVSVLHNGSLGHSQAVILPFRLSPSELGRHDFDHLIVEIATNEQVALRSSLANFHTLRSILDWTLQWCGERRIGVTLITMPELASYTRSADLRAFGMRRYLSDYAVEHGVGIYDGYEWLERWAQRTGVSPEDCFDTPAHMNAEMSHAFGAMIATKLSPVAAADPVSSGQQRHFTYVPLSKTEERHNSRTITRSTSLGSADLIQLDAGASFEVELGSASIVGIVHNVAGTNGVLEIEGAACAAKRLDGTMGDKLVLTAWGLRTPVKAAGRVTLRAKPVEYRPDLEHNHVSVWRPLHARSRRRPLMIEIAGLIVST